MKKALIYGITGQDGSYLAELLLKYGYQVFGVKRRSSSFNTDRINHLMKHEKFELFYGDVTDALNVVKTISKVMPDEVYNLSAQSHVAVSFEIPNYTGQVDAMGTLNILEAIRIVDDSIKFYQASTSELFGKVQEMPQSETTPFYPRSPYGVAKLYSFWMVKNYREAYGLHASNGILFNHESPRRGETFSTRKITMAVAKIFRSEQQVLRMGNLDAKRDWGYAPDFVQGMWMMLQKDVPDDYVLATGRTTTIREFITKAFKVVGFNIEWRGEGIDEKGYIAGTDVVKVVVDAKYFRPTEVEVLIGDYTKAKEKLNWEPTTTINELIELMVNEDLKKLQDEKR